MEEEIIDLLKKQEQVLTEIIDKFIKELKDLRKAIVIKTIEMKMKDKGGNNENKENKTI